MTQVSRHRDSDSISDNQFETLEPRMLLSGDGLQGAYYDAVDLTSLAGIRVDASINFPADALGNDADGMVTADDIYSIRWTGWVRVDQPGNWDFITYSNDGVRLSVDGQSLIDNWTQHTRTRDQGTINLAAGWHSIEMEYYQDGGTTDAELRFSGPGQNEAIIPQSNLSSTNPTTGLPPTVDAGPDQLVLLPDNDVTLDATTSDSDGTIDVYLWEQLAGPNTAILSGDDAEDLTASGLIQGVYEFRLTATDNDGNNTSDTVSVTVAPDSGGSAVITGDLMQWHRTTLSWDGPMTNEAATPSPNLDYRLDVTFTGPSGQQLVVPGFYAGDGAGGGSGNQWQVRFAADEVGQWSYAADFRSGTEVAVADDKSTFASAGFFDGDTGTFDIIASNKTGRDFRAPEHGTLTNAGGHYLTFAGSGTGWIKGGPDIPENLLGFDGFDNTPNAGHSYANHTGDWQPGDPDWDSDDADAVADDGRNLIGAINYIASTGANSVYFLPMNIGGDGNDTFPTITEQNKINYDISKLEQWEIVFSHAQENGILLHFQLAETESANENYHDNGQLGPQRKLYYRELIARFGHHNGLQWNLGEENDYGTAKHEQFAGFIKSVDPYDHPVTTHINTNQFESYYGPLLGNTNFDMTSFQATLAGLDLSDAESTIEEWRMRSAQAGVPWVVSVDEPQKIENDRTDASNGYPYGRTDFLWPIYLNGGGGFEWYVQQDGGGHGFDQGIDDFRLMDVALEWTGYALDFMHSLPFMEMSPDKSLGSSSAGGTTYVLQKPGDVYALYNEDGGTFSLDLTGQTGIYNVQWFNPREGGPMQTGTVANVSGGSIVSLGMAPEDVTEDWAVQVTASDPKLLFIRGGDRTGGFLEAGNDAERTEQLSDINNFTTGGGNHGWGTLRTTLENLGFVVEQIIEGSETTSGPADGIHIDLENLALNEYAGIVFGSNNAIYDQAAIDAVESYVRGGGAALFISDANFGGDWADASNSDQQFLDRFGWTMNQDNGTYSITRSNNEFLVPDHPIFDGVDAWDGEGVTPITLSGSNTGVSSTILANAEGNYRVNQPPFGSNNQGSTQPAGPNEAALIVGEVDDGRIVGHFDRNTFFNDGGAGTDITRLDNQTYAENLFLWLAGVTDGGSPPDPIEQAPFGGSAIIIADGTRVEAEDFDLGGQGVAYNDTDAGSNGTSSYRDTDVDLQDATDVGGGFNVGWIASGEWLEYSVDVTGGTYDITARVGSNDGNPGDVRLVLGGTPFVGDGTVLGTFAVEGTGGWQNWVDVTLDDVELLGGTDQILRFEMVGDSFNLNWIEFELADTTPPTVQAVMRTPDVVVRPDQLDALAIVFSESVLASIDASDLKLIDDSNGQPVDLSGATFAYDDGTSSATWDVTAAAIAPGYYTLSVSAAGITDAAGNMLDGNEDGTGGDDYVESIYVAIPGDANSDGTVNIGDLTLLAGSFGQSGTWADGDFNDDGLINIGDLTLLAGNFGTSAAAESLAQTTEPSASATNDATDYNALAAWYEQSNNSGSNDLLGLWEDAGSESVNELLV